MVSLLTINGHHQQVMACLYLIVIIVAECSCFRRACYEDGYDSSHQLHVFERFSGARIPISCPWRNNAALAGKNEQQTAAK